MTRQLQRFVIAIYLAGLLLVPRLEAQAAGGEEVLTNDDIVAMVKAHSSVDVIVNQIRNNPGNFTLTTKSIIALQQQGVPAKVITAMQEKKAAQVQAPAGRAVPGNERTPQQAREPKSLRVTESVGTWEVRESTNPLTDEVRKVVTAKLRGKPEGEFQVTAICDDDSAIGFFISNRSEGLVLKRSPVAQSMSTTKTFGGGQIGSISAPQSCVMMKVRVSTGPVNEYASQVCEDDDRALLVFLGNLADKAREQWHTVGKAIGAGAHAMGNDLGAAQVDILSYGLGEFTASLTRGISPMMSALGVPQMPDVLKASSMRIQLPFTNGDTSVIEIDPQDPTFRAYTARCVAPPAAASSASRMAAPMASTPCGYVSGCESSATARVTTPPSATAPSPIDPAVPKTVTVPANQMWTPTGILITANSMIDISATGAVSMKGAGPLPVGPDGLGQGNTHYTCNPLRVPAQQLPCWSLVGLVGNQIFYIGNENTFRVPASGQLFLGVNGDQLEDNNGYWTAIVSARGQIPRGPDSSAVPQGSRVNPLPAGGIPVSAGSGGVATSQGQQLSVSLAARLSGNYNLHGVTTEAQMLPILDNSIWIPDGKISEKQIYVIAGPCCGFSQDFYLRSRNYGDRVQFRWVETSPDPNARCLGYLAETATTTNPDVLSRMYQSMANPSPVPAVIRENAIRWNRGVMFAINGMRVKLDAGHNHDWLFPVLIWLSKDGVKVVARPAPGQLEEIVESVVARPEAAHIAPAGRQFLKRAYKVEPVPSTRLFAREDGVKLFMLPDEASQPILAFAKDHSGWSPTGQVTIDGERWFVLPALSTETWVPGFFVRADQVYQGQ